MISFSCHHYSSNNDCHCHCHYMQRIYVFFILSCLLLPWLVLSCLKWTSITIVIMGMTLYELVLHYHIISYHILCFFILSLLLIWSPFYSNLFYWIWFTIYISYSLVFSYIFLPCLVLSCLVLSGLVLLLLL